MNLYDTKVITCITCKKSVGEVEIDALIIRPLCGQCANPLSRIEPVCFIENNYQHRHPKIPLVG